MRALVASTIDAADPVNGLELREVDEPSPPDGWEIVEVRAAALNHHDIWTLKGVGIRPDDLPVILGTDAAGVTADGREVVVHAVLSAPGEFGDETIAPDFHLLSERGVPGALAERVAVPSRNLVPKPAGLTWEEAACLPTAYLTAFRMLTTKAGAKVGERLLVQGVGGGVATAAILLGVALGLEVHATGRTPERRADAERIGAIAHEPGARLPTPVDIVVETVGAATWGHSLRALRPGGRLIVSGATTGGDPPAELARLFWRGLSVLGTSMGTRDELGALLELLDRTGTRPLIDSVVPMDRAHEGFERLASGASFGKVVITP